MKKHLFIFLIILNLFQGLAYSQQNKIDSLLILLKTDKADTNKVIHLKNVCWRYGDIGLYDTALKYGNAALALAKQLNFKNGIAASYNEIGIILKNEGKYPEAIKNHFASLKAREEIGDKKGVANSYNNLGVIYRILGNYPEALKNYFASLKIREEMGDKRGINQSYNNIGSVYLKQRNYEEALKNYQTSLKISRINGDKKDFANAYGNIGIVYEELGNFEEALKYYSASLKIMEECSDKKGIAGLYNSIGVVYFDQAKREQDPKGRANKLDLALKNHFASLDLKQMIGDRAGIISSLVNIGDVFFAQRKYKASEEYLMKAKKLSEELGTKEKLKYAHKALAELDSAKGDFKGAYENYKQYILFRDSIDNEETRKKTIQNQMTYDFEKKEAVATAEHKKELENQGVIAEEKSRKQLTILLFVVSCLLLVGIFSAFIFRSLKITRKQKDIIETQKNIVEEQKQEVEHQKHLVEEHQKEIIDSITYAKRLQQAILPSDSELKKYLPEHFILYQPKDIVAGDFYWLEHKQDIVFIAAADSTGHGVPGAMVSVVCSNALNRAVNEFNLTDTGQILGKTRELVLETFAKSGEEIKDGMDISLLSINKTKNVIQWSGANNPLWYLQQISNSNNLTGQQPTTNNSQLIEIKPNKQSIGKTENPQPFTTHNIEYKAGTILYLMTDGYADQFGGDKGKKYKYKQLQEKLLTIQELSLAGQQETLANAFHEWKGNLEQVDDVTLIGIRI